MKTFITLLFVALLCNGCVLSQKRGTEWNPNAADKKQQLVTYVSPEEYDRMTPEERQRLHASVGVQGSLTWGGGSSQSKQITSSDLDTALKKTAQ